MAGGNSGRGSSVVWVLWSGALGGTEALVASLAAHMNDSGAVARVLFVGDSGPLAGVLDQGAVEWDTLQLATSRAAFAHGRALVSVLDRWSADAVVLPTVDALALVVRAFGFKGRIVAVDHGSLGDQRRLGAWRALARQLSRRLGAGALDVQVAVSRFVEQQMLVLPHGRHTEVVYNGVDTQRFVPAEAPSDHRGTLRLGVAARLVEGKGVREALSVAERMAEKEIEFRLEVAGTGPLASVVRAHPLAASGRVVAAGHVDDAAVFWRRQDCALVLSNGLTESFGMAAAEAMASALPVVASRAGGLVELVADGVTGVLVTPGDVDAATNAVESYATDPGVRVAHGAAGRRRVIERFSLEACARRYSELCGVVE